MKKYFNRKCYKIRSLTYITFGRICSSGNSRDQILDFLLFVCLDLEQEMRSVLTFSNYYVPGFECYVRFHAIVPLLHET